LALAAAPVFAGVIGNAPLIDDNNRLPGVTGGNIFYNGLAAGETITSVVALDIEGGVASPAGASVGAMAVTIGEVALDAARARTATIIASGANMAEGGGVSASLNADGSYAIKALDGFAKPVIVTIGDAAGAAQILAAPSTVADLSGLAVGGASGFTAATVAQNGDSAVVTCAPGQGALVISQAPVSVGSVATVSMDYEATGNDGVTVAVIGFDGAIDGSVVSYNQLTSQVEAGVVKNAAVSMTSLSGSILPAFQVTNGGAAQVVFTITNLEVINAGTLADFAVDPNVTVALPTTWSTNVNAGAGQVSGPVTTEGGALKLAGAATGSDPSLSNIWALIGMGAGTGILEAYVQNVTGAGTVAVVLTTTIGDNATAYKSSTAIGNSYKKVTVSGTFPATDGAASFAIPVVQAAGCDILVKDIAVRVVNQDETFDPALIP
jgi:hypothetical protein